MQRFVIVGGGTAGWMTASLLRHYFPADMAHISLVESPDVGIIGVGEGSTPTLKRFFQLLNISDQEWMPKCNATYKTNIRFVNWAPGNGVKDYSHPFISQPDTFTERAFQVNCRTRRLGLDTHVTPEDFLLNGVLAQQMRAPITPDNFPFRIEYGYHFDSHLLGEFLAGRAKGKGIEHIQGKVTDVAMHPSGAIKQLVMDNREPIDGDWFIDCSGFVALLIEKALKVPFQSFDDNLVNDSAVVVATERLTKLPVETTSTALTNGWCWQIPLQNRTGNGYVYSSRYTTHEDAARELIAHLGLPEAAVDETRKLSMRVGQRTQHWVKNCVAIGLAQGFIEPLEATALHLVQISVEMFCEALQKGEFSEQQQSDYNQKITQRFERVRDYIVAHYKLNARTDSQYWFDARNNEKFSDSLGHLLNAWFTREDLSAEIQRQNIESHFGSTSWHCLLAGYGAFPPLAVKQPGQGDLYQEQNVAQFVKGCALNFPDHEAQLRQYVNR